MASTVTRKTPSAYADLRRVAQSMRRYVVEAGWSVKHGAPQDVVSVAAINMLGAPSVNIPARDALSPAIQASLALIRKRQIEALLLAHRGRDPRAPLEQLASEVQAELQRSVRDFSTPPNAPSTVATKGFNNPLIGKGGGRILDHASAKLVVDGE